MVTYNGDSFDFPFVESRSNIHGINMYAETGFKRDQEDEFKSKSCAHMDAFRCVVGCGFRWRRVVLTFKANAKLNLLLNLGSYTVDHSLQMGQERFIFTSR